MRVVIINFSSSGLFHYAACLVNALGQRDDVQVRFITSARNNLSLIDFSPSVEVITLSAPHQLKLFFAWLLNFGEQWRFWRAVQDFRPTVVHMTDSYAIYVPHAWWLWRYALVLTLHDPVAHTGDVFRWSSRLIHGVQQVLSQRIVVHGWFLRDLLMQKRRVAPDKIVVIPHGEYSFFQRLQKDKMQKLPHSVLFFGRIVAYKGLDVLLKAVLQLQDSLPVTLLIAGEGSLAAYAHLLSPIKQKIIDNQAIPDDKVIHYFHKAAVVVLPYYEASQSGIIPIAMPAGIPVVASQVGALAEVIISERNGLLVPPGNPEALATALRRVLTNPALRQKLIAGGKATAGTLLNWSAIGKQYVALYKTLK